MPKKPKVARPKAEAEVELFGGRGSEPLTAS